MWFVGENPSQICGRNFWPCKLVSITLFDEFWHQASLFCDVLPSQPCAWPHIQFSSSFLSHSSTPWASGSDKICQDIFESGQSCSLSWNHPTRLAYLCGMRVAPKVVDKKRLKKCISFFCGLRSSILPLFRKRAHILHLTLWSFAPKSWGRKSGKTLRHPIFASSLFHENCWGFCPRTFDASFRTSTIQTLSFDKHAGRAGRLHPPSSSPP